MSPNLNMSGVVDLSQFAAKPAPAAKGGASYVLDVDEANFDQVMQLSTRHVVVAEFTSPRANAQAASDALAALANAAGGRWLLAHIDIDKSPRIAQLLQIQAVPMVVGVIGGQLAPLWQGTKDPAEMRAILEQLLQLAAENGIVGTAEPVGTATAEGDDEPDPRFAAADEALERGDYAAARAEFDKLHAQTPNDPEVIAGRAQTGLLARVQGIDADAVMADAAAKPDDLGAQLAAADVEMTIGTPEAAFRRLITFVRDHGGSDREAARQRLLELFETIGNADPAVGKARRDLMTALF